AYLTVRPADDDTDELGIVTHGPDSSKVTSQTGDLLNSWAQDRPAQPIVTAYPATTPNGHLEPGTRLTRPDTRLTISW
ncbi:methyltransferase, FxLD system, partial [Streptomyces sp. NPDC055078]